MILGYINNFVEHDHIKTIIICNEKELSKKLTQAKKSIGIKDNINIGIRVKSVHVNSPADKAGIMPGDIILTHNKDIVTNTKEFDNLQKLHYLL